MNSRSLSCAKVRTFWSAGGPLQAAASRLKAGSTLGTVIPVGPSSASTVRPQYPNSRTESTTAAMPNSRRLGFTLGFPAISSVTVDVWARAGERECALQQGAFLISCIHGGQRKQQTCAGTALASIFDVTLHRC